MKAHYFVGILFVVSLYWMYLLYSPFLMVITIAALLAISTADLHASLEKHLKSKLLASIVASVLLAALFFAPLGYFLATLTLKLNHIDPEVFIKVKVFISRQPNHEIQTQHHRQSQ